MTTATIMTQTATHVHIITNADLIEMLQRHDPKGRVCIEHDGETIYIDNVSRNDNGTAITTAA